MLVQKSITDNLSIHRNSNLFFFLAFFAIATFLFSSCTKDNDLDDFAQIEQEALTQDDTIEERSIIKTKGETAEADDTPTFDALMNKEVVEIDLTTSDKETTKNGRERIYQANINLSGGYYTYVYINKHNMNPNCKYIAKITRHSGDPDLYVFAGNGNNATERQIRRANTLNNGSEEVEATLADLSSHEGRMFFIVYADQHQHASCKLEIFKDCGGGHDDPQHCSPNILNKNWLQQYKQCNGCKSKIYCATIGHTPVIYVKPMSCYDVGYQAFDYHGNLVASWGGFGSNNQQPHNFTLGQLLWNPDNNCHDPNPTHSQCSSSVLQESWMQQFTNCNGCTSKIYCATYDNRPVVYKENDHCPDLGVQVYDLHGELVDAWGAYGDNLPTQPSGHFVKGQLIWNAATDCYNNGGGHNNCTPIQTEDFSSYHSGNYIAQSSHKWATWSNRYGEDARVNHQKELALTAHNDIIYKLGNRRYGSYELSFRMKVSGTAHFNIQNSEDSRVGGGVFGATFSNNGTFRVKTNSNGQSNHLNYSRHQWINVKIKFDFQDNRHEVKIGSKIVNVVSAQHFNQIGCINFYAPQGGDFIIDDIEFSDCNP